MAKKNQEPINITNELLTWSFAEFEQKNRTNTWYVLFGMISALLIGSALFVGNYLFVLIIILFDLILFLQDWKKPRTIQFTITPYGVYVNDKLHRMNDIDYFWIAFEPPHVSSVFFNLRSPLSPLLSIPLNGQNPLQVRETLLQFIPENLEKEDEPLADTIGKFLNL